MTISSVCFADNQWISLYQDSKGSISLDVTRVSTYKDGKDNYLDCWTKINLKDENITTFNHRYINIENLNYKSVQISSFRDDNYLGEAKPDEEWESPKPGSKLKKALEGIVVWATNNKDKVTVRDFN